MIFETICGICDQNKEPIIPIQLCLNFEVYIE